MKTIKLSSLLKRITGLPWRHQAAPTYFHIYADASNNDTEGVFTIYKVPKTFQIQHQHNVDYMVHAANILPHLLATAREASDAIAKLQALARPEDFCLVDPGDCDEIFEYLECAIRKAEKVNI